MGTYTTTTTLDTLMIGTTFDTATTAVASKCIEWAEDEINKMISKRYSISDFIASPPPIVTSWAEQLSQAYLYTQLSRGSKESISRADAISKPVRDNLEAIANNKLDITDSSGDVISRKSTVSGVLSNTKDYTQTFAEDSELSWATDRDKIDDISDSRD